MGAIIDLPAAAEPFHAELRGESFYLGAADAEMTGQLDEPWSRDRMSYGRWRIPATLIPAMQIALKDVARQSATQVPAADSNNPWAVESDADNIVITGPAYLYMGINAGTKQAPLETVEVEYRHLTALLAAVRQQ